MGTSRTVAESKDELDRFEAEAVAAGLADNTVRTYADRSKIFMRWLDGDYEFRGGD